MEIYILNYLSIPIWGILLDKKISSFIISVQMFLILALRNEWMGVDMPNYLPGFYYINSLSFSDILGRFDVFRTADLVYPFNYESGYMLFNWVAGQLLGVDFYGMIVIIALINVSTIGYFIYRFSPIPWLGFAFVCGMGIFTYMFGILRHELALSFFLLAVINLYDNNPKITVLFVLLSFLFHRSIIIAMPLLYLMNYEVISKIKYIKCLLIWLCLLPFTEIIFKDLLVNLLVVMGKSNYETGMIDYNNLIILLLVIALLLAMFCDFDYIKDSIHKVSVYAVLGGLYIQLLGMMNNTVARSTQFFTFFLAILIPYVISEYQDEFIRFITIPLVYFLIFVFYIYSLSNSYIVPYVAFNGVVIG